MTSFRLARILRARPVFFAGYAIGAISYLLLTPVPSIALRGVSFFRVKDRDISFDAKKHQEGEWTVFSLTVLGAIASFAAIILFSHTTAHKTHQDLYLAFVVVTLALSWLTTNVTFAYRYAHEYYSYDEGGPEIDRGIDFPKDDKPDYLDFIYFSFVLGMTFQVSDCNITSKKLRRVATLQGLIGFLFNTVILALSVNIAASLL
jgi:uncharacterized membrane protein